METKYVSRILPRPNQSFFLFGPRGTGKTTWIQSEIPGAYCINLLDEARYLGLISHIETFAQEMRIVEPDRWVVIDEVQRIPQLLNEVHRFIEERGLRFALTGSSARKLRGGGVNLLAGRALVLHMHPFLPEELGARFDLETVLRYGSIPLIWNATEKEATLKAYIQTYLKEEIKAEALVRNLPGFARFLPIAGIFHGQTVNVSSIARDAGVGRNTVEGYLDILEDTLLVFRLPAFEAKLRVRERRHPKLYWIDAGIARAVSGKSGQLHPEERGALFEGWVASLLLAYSHYKAVFEDFSYWSPADSTRTEIDFLLRREKEFLAIEAKAVRSIGGEHLRGMRAVSSLNGLVRRIVVYCGDRALRTEDGIDILPVEDFCRLLASGSLWHVTGSRASM